MLLDSNDSLIIFDKQFSFTCLPYNFFLVEILRTPMLITYMQLLLVQDGKLYGRDPIFSVITRAAGLPEAAKNHDIQKNEYIIQLGQVKTLLSFIKSFDCT